MLDLWLGFVALAVVALECIEVHAHCNRATRPEETVA